MDLHVLGEERSIAYHRVIAERLAKDRSVLERARVRVREWLEKGDVPPAYARAWDEILGKDPAAIRAFLTDPGERARELRQSSPFAGVLSPAERWEIWRRTRDHLEDAT